MRNRDTVWRMITRRNIGDSIMTGEYLEREKIKESENK
jgi:hypothetical protein